MNMRIFFYSITLLCTSTVGIFCINSLDRDEILIPVMLPALKCGVTTYKINLFKYLKRHHFNVSLVAIGDSVQQELIDLRYPFKKIPEKDAYEKLLSICVRERPAIIHVNSPLELDLAKKIVKKNPAHIVYTLHSTVKSLGKSLEGLDGLLVYGQEGLARAERENKDKKLGIKHIDTYYPFFNEEPLMSFIPQHKDKDTFFKEVFKIETQGVPVICMIGNFYQNKAWKNHDLLINAIKKIICDRHYLVHVMFAGDGARMQEMKSLAAQLGLSQYIHFLGFTNKIPALLYYSDIKALTSKEEGFGIALLEAALMKKPLIGATNTGMTNIIKDGVTGLLFKNGDVDDLADKIELLLKYPELCKKLGENAYLYTLENFTSEATIKRLSDFYQKVLVD